jgi:hypothetical protein
VPTLFSAGVNGITFPTGLSEADDQEVGANIENYIGDIQHPTLGGFNQILEKINCRTQGLLFRYLTLHDIDISIHKIIIS